MDRLINELADRYREAWLTSHRVPAGIRLGYTAFWPEMNYDKREQIRRAEREVLSVQTTPDDVDRMLECVRWLTGLVEEDRKLIWLRASGLTWRDIAEHTGIPRTSVHRYWHRALLRIVINQGQRQQI